MTTGADSKRDSPPAADEGQYDLRILTSIRRIIRAVDLHSRKLASRHDITGPQLICLLDIVSAGSCTPTALSKSVHLSRSTIVGIIDRLVAKGLVERHRDLRDRRVVLLSATKEDRRLAETAPSPLQDRLASGLHDLSEAAQAKLAASLERVVELMEAKHLDASPILETGPIQHMGDEHGPSGALNAT
jgi:DNA-binding MarR family transcriptional regulator